MTRTRQARIFLIAGAMILLATAAFHSTGLPMVSGWFEGSRRAVLRFLWLSPVLDWTVVALVWLLAAKSAARAARPFVLLAAVIPAAAAAGLAATAGPGHPGVWMLAAAAVLAIAGALRLP